MTPKQTEILEKPVEELTDDEVFYPVPLAGMMTNGLPYVDKVVDKQVELLTKKAAQASRDDRPPELRVTMDNFRKVSIAFTQTMELPEEAFLDF